MKILLLLLLVPANMGFTVADNIAKEQQTTSSSCQSEAANIIVVSPDTRRVVMQ